ncbi:MAG: pantoate--beta-alanine ligase [Gemmatimonadetes bacterium]|nr:pantoate--beta-alanine ligase [Gemmatimonadota bacterium]
MRDELERKGVSLGFVPTMGALHPGHTSLIEQSLAENNRTVVSIFVNPTQFNDPTDLQTYPRPLDHDRALLEDLKVDYLFLPDRDTIYPDDCRFEVTENEVSKLLCGAHRPGHFDGVLSVVMRLFNIIQPQRAYFGEKDYQQYQLIKEMVKAFFLGVEIRRCPIVRDPDGVALSSRNALLSADGRTLAAEFARILKDGDSPSAVRTALEARNIEVEYVEEMFGRRLAAVVIDGVRLIDNVPLVGS